MQSNCLHPPSLTLISKLFLMRPIIMQSMRRGTPREQSRRSRWNALRATVTIIISNAKSFLHEPQREQLNSLEKNEADCDSNVMHKFKPWDARGAEIIGLIAITRWILEDDVDSQLTRKQQTRDDVSDMRNMRDHPADELTRMNFLSLPRCFRSFDYDELRCYPRSTNSDFWFIYERRNGIFTVTSSSCSITIAVAGMQSLSIKCPNQLSSWTQWDSMPSLEIISLKRSPIMVHVLMTIGPQRPDINPLPPLNHRSCAEYHWIFWLTLLSAAAMMGILFRFVSFSRLQKRRSCSSTFLQPLSTRSSFSFPISLFTHFFRVFGSKGRSRERRKRQRAFLNDFRAGKTGNH